MINAKWLSDIRIGVKLIGLVVTAVLGLVFLTSMNFMQSNRNSEALETVNVSSSQLVWLSSSIVQPLGELRALSLSLVLAPDDAMKQQVEAEMAPLVAQLGRAFEDWQARSDNRTAQNVNTIRNEWAAYLNLLNYTRERVSQGYREAAFLNVVEREGAQYALLSDQVNQVFVDMERQVNAVYNQSVVAAESNERASLIVSAITALLVAGIGFLISGNITRPLLSLQKKVKALAEGELALTISGQNRKDELGDLAREVQVTVDHLRENLQTINNSSDLIKTVSLQLGETSADVSTIIGRQLENADTVASAMTEMATSVAEVAGNAASTSEATGEANQEVENAKLTLERTSQDIQTLTRQINQTSELIDSLREDADRIGSVVEVIGGISEQTNLLALNAAIEAARAGESGRGFAVVADEVRNLAQRTSGSTEEINEIITTLQKRAHQAMSEMATSQHEAKQTIESAENTVSRLARVANQVDHVNAMNLQIAAATEEQQGATQEMDRSVVEIRDISQQSAQASELVNEKANALSEQVTTLRHVVGQYRF
ncbi:methyl-accepting chemotaxis protein [Thaumasiovibrio subtropicus]|uniref:methyl-accepting chemotaxis protein n=1 Tax=Thaumasiovibrio subtropicus TaxID=1891207 RepID=UPI000B34B9EB|nr:methyl-accepting chemotaxis protein [Thaumasiovibrio subtropicus]